ANHSRPKLGHGRQPFAKTTRRVRCGRLFQRTHLCPLFGPGYALARGGKNLVQGSHGWRQILSIWVQREKPKAKKKVAANQRQGREPGLSNIKIRVLSSIRGP